MWTHASFPFGLSVATTPSHGPRCLAMLITRVLPNSVLAYARASTRPFGRTRSGTARLTIATACPSRRDDASERQRRLGFGLGLASGGGAAASWGATVVRVSGGAGFTEAADRAE